jgi:ubiquinone/menaquinone biosynthesis C-methylase UbiE
VTATEPRSWSYERYLDAKVPVEDRALHRGVIDALREALAARVTPPPLRVLDVGGGTATMIRRAIAWRLFGRAAYTLLDADDVLLTRGLESLKRWGLAAALQVEEGGGGVGVSQPIESMYCW